MNLPPINLPKIPIPFEIPQMMHPCIVHFAIALPLVILFLEIINLIVKKRAIGVVSFLFALFASAAAIAAFMTGNVDAKLANMDSVIQAHKNLGAYVVVVSMAVVVFKLFSVMIRTGIVKAIYLMILIVYVGFIANEAMSGKDLVYNNGVNIKQITYLKSMNQSLHTGMNEIRAFNKQKIQEINELNSTIKSLKEQIAKQNAKIELQDNQIQELKSQENKIQQETKQVIEDVNSSIENNITSESNITEI
jgi:uncharacterized membrane protein